MALFLFEDPCHSLDSLCLELNHTPMSALPETFHPLLPAVLSAVANFVRSSAGRTADRGAIARARGAVA